MKPYNDYSTHLKERYGSKVYRIGLDAGFTCPHRCVYCNNDGSRASYANPEKSIDEQLSGRIEHLKRTRDAKRFIAYFQSYSNTNASVSHLKIIYDRILPFGDIVGLSIGTRPDCIDADKLTLISSYSDRYEVWVEYGLQSIHDNTLKAIKRGHNFKDFLDAYHLTKEFPISVCAHVILGLPGETREDMINTARKLSELKIDGVKIHLLHILKGSELEDQYKEGAVRILSQEEYADLVCDFLENLSGSIIIQRLTGQGKRESHIAPLWALDKLGTIGMIEDILQKRNSYQGIGLTARS